MSLGVHCLLTVHTERTSARGRAPWRVTTPVNHLFHFLLVEFFGNLSAGLGVVITWTTRRVCSPARTRRALYRNPKAQRARLVRHEEAATRGAVMSEGRKNEPLGAHVARVVIPSLCVYTEG
ncbi:hypothetical protein ACFU8I_18020 [Streptomyces sp. NPDC057540]|uniref:hypothetical protein n=1 Tax=Streptomyces sp. NPDC057540 TaxID=3346160 RepID=UPI00367B7257